MVSDWLVLEKENKFTHLIIYSFSEIWHCNTKKLYFQTQDNISIFKIDISEF
jgi:hypothetical protein